MAVVDMVTERAETVADELTKKGIDSLAVIADVTKSDQVQAMINTILAHWGRLTIGVNNAGIGLWADAETMSEEDWHKVLDINMNGIFLCAQAEGRVMLESRM